MRTRFPVIALVMAGLAFSLTPAACGGNDDQATTSPAPASEAPDAGAASPGGRGALPPEFVDCMAERGVNVEQSADIHSPEAQQAFQACLPLLHSGGTP